MMPSKLFPSQAIHPVKMPLPPRFILSLWKFLNISHLSVNTPSDENKNCMCLPFTKKYQENTYRLSGFTRRKRTFISQGETSWKTRFIQSIRVHTCQYESSELSSYLLSYFRLQSSCFSTADQGLSWTGKVDTLQFPLHKVLVKKERD